MAEEYREVKGKLSGFGKFFRFLFLGWQALMVLWFLSYTVDVSPIVQGATSDAEKAGAGIGIALAWSLILFFWVGGSVILGIPVLMTRRTRMLVRVEGAVASNGA